jgi:predicted TIM-barrel fold metal-dependent hydrolase
MTMEQSIADSNGPLVIDMHVHLDWTGEQDEVEECRRLAARADIDRIVNLTSVVRAPGLSDPGTDPSPEHIRRMNDRAMRLAREHADFVTSFCYLNPAHDPAFVAEEIDRCIAAGPCRGVKLWVAVRASDPRCDGILERTAELGVPVLQHAWDKTVGQLPGESTPADVAELARRHRSATIVMGHLTGCGAAGVLAVADCPNVLVETSGGQSEAGLVRYAIEHLGIERVMFGSDWPVRQFTVARARVEAAGLSEADRALVLGGNAARLLRLNEDKES